MKKLSTLIFSITLSISTYGQESALPSPCFAEAQRLCSDLSSSRKLIDCLIEQKDLVSLSCRQAMERLTQSREDASERGGGALTSFGSLNAFGPILPLFSYDGRSISGDPSLIENKAAVSAPLLKGSSEVIGGSLALGQLHLGSSPRLSSGILVPQNFSRIEIGAQYRAQLSRTKNWGLRTSIGYAGDRLSRAGRDASLSINAHYGFPGSDQGYWILAVFASNNGPFVNYLPIPGVLYLYRTSTFTGLFGFPVLSLQWTPLPAWGYSVSVFGLNVHAEVAYGRRDDLQLFVGYQFMQQSYIPSFRAEARDRLIFQEQRLGGGARMPVGGAVFAEFQAGRSFDRSIHLGKGLFNRSGGSVDLVAGWWWNWGLRIVL